MKPKKHINKNLLKRVTANTKELYDFEVLNGESHYISDLLLAAYVIFGVVEEPMNVNKKALKALLKQKISMLEGVGHLVSDSKEYLEKQLKSL